jgi:hypothetical protein
MLPRSYKPLTRIFFGGATLLLAWLPLIAEAVLPTGGFLAVMNETTNNSNGDSQRSITFFDADEIGSGPLFSVFVPWEDAGTGGGATNFEELQAITADPATGDIYFLSFDSGVPGTGGSGNPPETSGDMDLYRIQFSSLYNHWSTNFQGQDVRTLGGALTVGGQTPTGPNANNLDYVTYGNPNGANNAFSGTGAAGHSNTFARAGTVERLGEINRNAYTTTSNFYPSVLEFIDSTHLLMIDDDRASHPSSVADDHDYRIIERVSTSPGQATSDGINGGYNGNTSQSWQSRRIAQVLLDAADASEPESGAYYQDPISGVRGMWVTESDFSTAAGGDSVAFLQLDANNNSLGYRPYAAGANPLPSPLDNDPFAGNDNRGSADNVFVDKDTGDLIIVESSFNDTAAGVGSGDGEPGVLRVPINYDNGSGQIAVGAWAQKMILNPTKDPGDTFKEHGYWSTYDSANNIVYFFDPGASGETPAFQVDVHALDLDTGVTTSYMNVDDSVALFFGGTNEPFGDKQVFFSLGVAGDQNGDNVVDARDYVLLRKLNPNIINNPGLGIYTGWRSNFGTGTGAGFGGQAVPEPASVGLVLLGLAAFGMVRNRRPR